MLMDSYYRQFFDLLPLYVTVQSPELKIIEANQRFRRDFGEIENRYCYQVYKGRVESCERCPVLASFQDGECHCSEEMVKTVSGKEVSVLVNTSPIKDEEGRVWAVMEVATDITEQKKLECLLRESQNRYRLLFEEVPCFISVQDPLLKVVDANRRFREAFGHPFGRHCYEIYKHRTEECIPCPVQETFQDGGIHHSEEIVTDLHGEQRNVMVWSAPMMDENGNIQAVIEMSTDITPIRKLESQLSSIGLLIGSISHGIKGLLTGLDGGVYLVNTGMQKGDQNRVRKGWEMVQRNIDRIRSMVLDILYYAKDRKPNLEEIDAIRLVEEVGGIVLDRAKEHSVVVNVEGDRSAGTFLGDVKAIRAMLINLVENSIDACRVDQGKSDHKVNIKCMGTEEKVLFIVSDNGIGMDQETREKAFTLFFSSKGGEGTGLGLFIANKIASAHGGKISVESEKQMGTCFTVEIPRRPEIAK